MGSPGDDTFDYRGQDYYLWLNGNGGDDQLYGSFRDDTLLGGLGDDLLVGGAGADKLDGEGGHDVLVGGVGKDILLGGAGDDMLVGGAGDALTGGAGADFFVIEVSKPGMVWVKDFRPGEGDDYSFSGFDFETQEVHYGPGGTVLVYNLETGEPLVIRGLDFGDGWLIG